MRLHFFFLLFFVAHILSNISLATVIFAVSFSALQLKGSLPLYGLLACTGTLPGLLCNPFLGKLTDALPIKRVLFGISLINLGNILFSVLFLHTDAFPIKGLMVYNTLASFVQSSLAVAIPKAYKYIYHDNQNSWTSLSGATELGTAISQFVAPSLGFFLLSYYSLLSVFEIHACIGGIFLLAVVFSPLRNKHKKIDTVDPKGMNSRQVLSYIFSSKGLLLLIVNFFGVFLLTAFASAAFIPFVLCEHSSSQLNQILIFGALGGIFSSLLSVWGYAPKNLLFTILLLTALQGTLIMALPFFSSLGIVVTGIVFLFYFCTPLLGVCNQIYWLKQVPFDIQGRVFALRNTMISLGLPIGYLIAGPLPNSIVRPLLSRYFQIYPVPDLLAYKVTYGGIGISFISIAAFGFWRFVKMTKSALLQRQAENL